MLEVRGGDHCGRPARRARAALQARESRRRELEAQREQMRCQRRLRASDTARVHQELMALANAWRRVLVDDPMNSRPIVSTLLKGRVTIEPVEGARKRWTLRGEGTLVGLFQKVIPGESFPLVWRPQADSMKEETLNSWELPHDCRA